MNASDFEKPEIPHRGRPKKDPVVEPTFEIQEPQTPEPEEVAIPSKKEQFVLCKYVGPEQHQYSITDGKRTYVFSAPNYTWEIEKDFAKTLDKGFWPVSIAWF